MKNIYTEPEMDIVSFEAEDVIATSFTPENDELDMMKKNS